MIADTIKLNYPILLAKQLLDEGENNITLPKAAKLGMKYAVGYLLDEAVDFLIEEYKNQKCKEIREAYEEGLLDLEDHYTRENVSETNDGRDDFVYESFRQVCLYDPNDSQEKQIDQLLSIYKELDEGTI